jgi:hypothetical protein
VEQLAFGDEPPLLWVTNRLGVEWWAFHQAHPEVADALASLARPLIYQGHRHLGIAMLWETLRYRTMIGARPDEAPFGRLNNSYRSFYARLLMETHRDLGGIFETRHLRS